MTLLARRIVSLIERRGLGAQSDPEEGDALLRDDPGLAALYAASIRCRIAAGPKAGNRVGIFGDSIDGDSLDPFRARAAPRFPA